MSNGISAGDKKNIGAGISGGVVKFPSDEELKVAFEAYVLAVGKVAHAWNYLQETLAKIFVIVVDSDRHVALAVWYSTENDRAQRQMLRAALAASKATRWTNRPMVREDIDWLLDRANSLADERNNAIHTPCAAVTNTQGTKMAASFAAYTYGHQRARRLWGKKLLDEFTLCERSAETLSRFAQRVESGLISERLPWPDRPSMPSRGQKNMPQGQPRPPRIKPRLRRRRSSRP